MVENYAKDLNESVYHGAVVSAPAIGFTTIGKSLIKMSLPPPPPLPSLPESLGKFDFEDGAKLVVIVISLKIN